MKTNSYLLQSQAERIRDFIFEDLATAFLALASVAAFLAVAAV